jgi:hypothetical protein
MLPGTLIFSAVDSVPIPREQENMPAREGPGTHFLKLTDQVLVNPFRGVSPLFLNPSGTVR